MTMQRRTFLKLSTAAAATAGCATLLGASPALAGALGTAPTKPFAVGVRQ
ncbi:twin-arginine translocation signal domain-containing protein, partial [Lentzea aerocolonigenes]